jgi:threonine-phosphate decarboxylase
MVTHAIILAAGKGSRLAKYTKSIPKALLPIKYGQSIIERLLHQLQDNGFKDVVIVIGYMENNTTQRINELSKNYNNLNINVVSNPEFETTGTLKSLLIGMENIENLNQDILVVEGDVVCDSQIIEKVLTLNCNTILGDSSKKLDDEAMKYITDKSGVVQRISKDIPSNTSTGEALGIVYLTNVKETGFFPNAKKVFKSNNYSFYEEVIDTKSIEFKVIDVYPFKWTEVDFPVEYKKARQIFSGTEKIKFNQSIFDETNHSPSIFSLINDFDIPIKDFCFLANPYLLNDSFIDEMSLELKQLFSTYPPLQNQLAESVSKFHNNNILPENIAVGNGATELIHIINLNSNGSIVPIPTFSEYIDNVDNVLTYQLKEENNFDLDMEEFIEFCRQQDRRKYTNIILINPNNPIGRLFQKHEMELLLNSISDYTIIIDESFIDFSDKEESVLDLINDFKNLVVVKSFGKTLGMPGARVGAIYSSKNYIKKVSRKIPVWNVNCIASHILNLMSDNKFKEKLFESISMVKNDTKELYNDLKSIDRLKVFQPYGNFVMAKIINGMMAKELRNLLLEDGIFIRDCTNKIGLGPEYIRIASRTKEENKDIVRHLEILLIDYSIS